MIEKVAAWCLGLVLVVSLLLSAGLVIAGEMKFADFSAYWTPVLTALVTWIVKGKSSA